MKRYTFHRRLPRKLACTTIFSVILGLSSQTIIAEETPRTLTFLNWADYLDPELVTEFEQQYNVDVKEFYYESDEARDTIMLESDGQGYDLVMLNHDKLPLYVKKGWLTPLNPEQIPNLKHIDPKWLNANPGYDGYAVPFFWGTLGIAYRADLVETEITSWLDILKPIDSLKGKIAMMRTTDELFSVALSQLGYSINSANPQEIAEAEQLLIAQKPFLKDYYYLDVDGDSALVSGDVHAAMLYNGDALFVQEFHPDIQYASPKEGGMLWLDQIVVSKNSANKDLAMALINFLNDPKIAARQAEFVYYPTPNLAAEKYLPQEFFDNPAIYPSAETLEKFEFVQPTTPRAAKRRNEVISRLLQN